MFFCGGRRKDRGGISQLIRILLNGDIIAVDLSVLENVKEFERQKFAETGEDERQEFPEEDEGQQYKSFCRGQAQQLDGDNGNILESITKRGHLISMYKL